MLYYVCSIEDLQLYMYRYVTSEGGTYKHICIKYVRSLKIHVHVCSVIHVCIACLYSSQARKRNERCRRRCLYEVSSTAGLRIH